MILNTGQRTDIPAFYSQWFANRLKEGVVLAGNPYYPQIVYRYTIDPSVIDLIAFCSKNPEPMLKYMDLLKPYRQLWHVTITPYGRDIEPNVPDKWHVMDVFRKLSGIVGSSHLFWRYDPIFINERYTLDYHLRAFSAMSEYLEGSADHVIISFIDLYEKTKKNFPGVREVTEAEMQTIASSFASIAEKHHMKLMTCHEDHHLSQYGIDTLGCMRQSVIEEVIGLKMNVPHGRMSRAGCTCLLGADIGAYSSCPHACRYCYADYDQVLVRKNLERHDVHSPLLIGHLHPDDEVHQAEQKSWIALQQTLF